MTRDPLFTGEFWMRSATQMIHAAAGAAVGPLALKEIHNLRCLPFDDLLTSATVGALVSLLASISSQGVPGTATATFMPKTQPKFLSRNKKSTE